MRAALEDPAGTFASNVIGTAHVLDAARDAAVVCVTSDKCYAPGPGPHREGDPLGGARPVLGLQGGAGARGGGLSRRARRARRDRARRQRDRRRRLGARPAAARPRARPRVRRADRAAPPRRRAPVAARARPAGRLPAARRAPARSPADWAAAWNFGPAGRASRSLGRGPGARALAARRRVEPPGDSVEAPALRLDASTARERLGWAPRLATAQRSPLPSSGTTSVRDGGRRADRDTHADRGSNVEHRHRRTGIRRRCRWPSRSRRRASR